MDNKCFKVKKCVGNALSSNLEIQIYWLSKQNSKVIQSLGKNGCRQKCLDKSLKTNRLNERCLRTVYSDNQSIFEELLEKDNTISVHQRNLQFLATELYKVLNGLSPDLMKDVFPLNDYSGYNTRNKRTFKSRHVKTVRYGTGSLAYLAPKIWELVPNEMKNLESLAAFKTAIKKWKTRNCPCRLCKNYIPQVGFV